MSVAPAVRPSTALILKVANQRLKDDPLLTFGWASDAQRRVANYIREYEVLFRAGNGAGKTYLGAALAIAMLRGWKELRGVELPDLPSPCTGWCMVQTYKGQVDAAQAALSHWLGKHPHHYQGLVTGGAGAYQVLWVSVDGVCKHGMDEHCATCSKLVFHCSESTSGVGGRTDFVWCDEPPKKKTWDECRQRGRGDRPLIKYLTVTPKEKVWWGWMPADFHDCEDKPKDGFVEVRSSFMDNKRLSAKVKQQKHQAALKDERPKAVIYGDYVDLAGESPFPSELLDQWMKRAREPRIEEIVIHAERRTPEGDVVVPVRCKVEIFHGFEEGETYLGVLDPATFLRLDQRTGLVATDWTRDGSSSRGVPDPCGLHIYARRSRKLVARFIGYCGAHGLGSLGGQLARRYGNALLDTDLTGGPGEPTVRALTKAGYYRLNSFSPSATAVGQGSTALGFKMGAANRAEMVAAIQQALLDQSLLVESKDAIRSLMEVTYVITPSGRERPEASYGAKDEDMICMGRALHLMNTLPIPAPKAITGAERLEKAFGFTPMRHRPAGTRPMRPRPMWNPAR